MVQEFGIEGSADTIENHLVKRCLRFTRLLSLIALIFPLLAVIGWILDIEILKQIHSSLPAMQPNTACALILAAIVMYFSREGVPKSIRLINYFIAVVISALGLLTLSEYVMGLDFGIDRIFIEGVPTSAQPFPGRPSPQASLNFFFIGIGLLFYNLRIPLVRFGQFCALIVGTNSIVAFTGYIFSTEEFYGFPAYAPAIGLAVPTAITFVILVLGLLCSHPRDGMMSLITSETQSGSMARSILFAGIFIPPFIGAVTRIGVITSLYDENFQVSLFTVVIIGIILRTTWKAARYSEKIELKEKNALNESQIANQNLNKALVEREMFAALIENSSDFIGIADPSGRPIYVNPAGRRMVGLDDISIENTQIPEYYTPDQRSLAEDEIVKSMKEKGFWKGETFFRHWITQAPIPVSDDHFMIREPTTGRILGMGTVTRDITEIKRLQEAVRLSEAKASGIVSISADAIISMDEDQKIIIFNEGAEKIFGYSKSEIIGQPIEILMPERFRFRHRHLVEQFSREETTSRRMGERGRSILGIRKNGEEFPAEASISKLEIGGTKIFTAAVRDITNQQNREVQLQRAIRTREDVLAIVSHDLKNPLSIISLTAQLLRRVEKIDVKKLVDYVDKILRTTEQMQQLIGNLLDFSKIESGTFSVDVYAENLSDVLKPVVGGVMTLAESKKQTLEAKLRPDLPEVACDADRIGQVMSNLLGNAIKFTPEGGTVSVSAIQKGNSVIVTVSDTGPGIPSDQLSKIFDRYWQPKETQKQGSGLGLSIAKGIVKAHGGRIWAESSLGEGTHFHFTIPLATDKTKRGGISSDSQRTTVEKGSMFPSPPSI